MESWKEKFQGLAEQLLWHSNPNFVLPLSLEPCNKGGSIVLLSINHFVRMLISSRCLLSPLFLCTIAAKKKNAR